MAGGEYCAIWLGPELPGDQRADDAKSVCFDSAPLDAPLDIVGAPVVRLTLSADRPQRNGRGRLCDVQPDGASTRITYGVLNLCHRNGHEFPQAVVPGETMEIALQARRHRLSRRRRASAARGDLVDLLAAGLAVAGAGHADAARRRARPAGARLRRRATNGSFAEPEGAAPWRIETLRRKLQQPHRRARPGDRHGHARDRRRFRRGARPRPWPGAPAASPASAGRIDPDDPLSAHGETHWTQTLSRTDGRCAPRPSRRCAPTRENFHLTGRIEAYRGRAAGLRARFRRDDRRATII